MMAVRREISDEGARSPEQFGALFAAVPPAVEAVAAAGSSVWCGRTTRAGLPVN